MNKRRIGSQYEDIACEYLNKNGVKILEKNYRSRFGEIDIIGKDKDYYVFIEVKYRKNRDCGNPIEAVDRRKQIRICRVADYYRISKRLPDSSSFRFDVIAILDSELAWYKNAFNYIM